MRQRITTETQFNGSPIRATENYPVIGNIIEGLQAHLTYMRRRHAQVLYASLVLKYPVGYYPANPTGNVSSTMRKLHQKAQRENVEIMTDWTMENSSAGSTHFNIIIFADGTKLQSGYRLKSWLDGIWSREIGVLPESGYVHLNANNPNCFPPAAAIGLAPSYELRLRRNSPHEQTMADNIANAASYYAKIRSKENISSGCRSFDFSQIPQK